MPPPDTTPADMAATHAAAFTQARPWSAAEFTKLLDHPLCFATGDARCFTLVRVVADEAELLTIATHPDHQRQGLARAVMADWQATAQARGAARGFLDVAADNSAAIALYQSSGYEISGQRRGYYRRAGHPAVDALLMSCAFPLR
ncbi:MAG: ribosomal-protein-alanine N-acetyltransferase [Paracoccaceae bacterium]|jgi:ribosomal-protein-alanine N-acetyltransferase